MLPVADVAIDTPLPPLTQHRRPLPALTGIRFIAALQVLLFHYGAAFAARHGAPRFAVHVLGNGYQAVSLFFLLSGFILTYTYAGQMKERSDIKRFFQARFARIYPVYFLSLAVAGFYSSYFPRLSDAAACVFMVQSWNPRMPHLSTALNIPAWTISVEVVFYLAFPLVLRGLLHRRLRTLRWLALLLVLIIVFGHTLVDADSYDTFAAGSWRGWVPMPLWRLPEFILGVVAGLHFLRSRAERHTGWLLDLAAIAMVAVLATAGRYWGSLLVVPNIVLLYTLARSSHTARLPLLARLLSTRTMRLLGGASYTFYLMQLMVRLYLDRFWPATSAHKETLLPMAHLVLLTAVSVLVFLFYEEPLRRALRRWFARHDQIPATTPTNP
jgi:peptidoglycan/LPS O-acetylase OafA/YrhL